VLHTLWDSMQGIATVLTAVFTATPARARAFARGVTLQPSVTQIQTFTTIYIGGLVLISIIAIVILWRLWHAAGRAGMGPWEAAMPPRSAAVHSSGRLEG